MNQSNIHTSPTLGLQLKFIFTKRLQTKKVKHFYMDQKVNSTKKNYWKPRLRSIDRQGQVGL